MSIDKPKCGLIGWRISSVNCNHFQQVVLASKVLFLMKPEIILPYDRRAKRALGLRVSDTDYVEYLRRATQYENQVVVQLDKILEQISHMLDILEQGYEHLEIPFNQLRKKRLLDKMLWVEGGD